jgi:hypothetical protein
VTKKERRVVLALAWKAFAPRLKSVTSDDDKEKYSSSRRGRRKESVTAGSVTVDFCADLPKERAELERQQDMKNTR